MAAPRFWYQPKGLFSTVLAPLGWLYAMGTARRLRGASYRASVPVICIGNINVGGTGKTPTTIALAQKLISMGIEPHVVSRGYGGRLQGPVRVVERSHTAHDVGDEPLLIAAFTPTWIAKDRAAGVKAAEAAGAEIILLDDGFQNPAVHKDISIVVVDAKRGFGNGAVMPAGPLREPVDKGLKRADFVLTIGDQNAFDRALPVPRLRGSLKPLMTGMQWQGMRVLAFAGIGDPSKFFATLRSLGAEVIRGEALEDHQPLTEALMTRLELEGKTRIAQLVTTEKDAVRLPDSFRPKVLTLPVRLELEDWEPLLERLAPLLEK
ncbi:tetraacyldisaccharide 4'-kinase [Marivivens sp. LCG002]|uniref:tetraacyldisaccharide 4'-kinase n=1 Tax=Marivivens sp. LCG002 TaxID=3051171 RepID=UPI002553637D|nr:tetraacyldisaccharide 4'-kinase [Marivivens sp. LCG002]WIV50667.1 tetraacyldisaccharide 4'-kinase [Marivivens sp. LCG002]